MSLKDNLPAGFTIPGSGPNLCVTNGAGVSVPYTALNGGDTNPFFESGIKLTDPNLTQGAIGTFNATSGSNVIVVTYDLEVDISAVAGQIITNTATILNYAGLTGGVNYATTTDFATQTT